MSNPRIGVSGVVRSSDGVLRTGVNVAYVQAIAQAGGVPLILSPLLGPSRSDSALDAVTGVVLTGGEDVDPAAYGEIPAPALGSVDRSRDAFEFALLKSALRRRLPVLAICRGIQLVNVALGGTLWQDLPTQRPSSIAHNHTGDRDARTHRILVEPGTRTAAALGVTGFAANSFHHQGIKDLAPGLVVSATAEDGLIEGVELGAGQPWLVAIQWHPEEFHAEGRAPDHGLFTALVQEARRLPEEPVKRQKRRVSKAREG